MTAQTQRSLSSELFTGWSDRLNRAAGLASVPVLEIEGAPERVPSRPRRTASKRTRYHRICQELRQLRSAHDAVLRELRLAEQVQKTLLPKDLPKVAGIEFGAGLRPAEHLAGDFYSVFRLDREHLGFYVGDVVGHGPAAALMGIFIMQSIRPKLIQGNRYEILAPATVLQELNRRVMEAEFPNDAFFTMIYGVLDTTRWTWSYCCGGHPPALVLRPGERPRLLEVTAPALGLMDAPFEQAEVSLRAHDRLVLYSDGVGHAHFGDSGPGLDGMIGWLDERFGATPQTLVDGVIQASAFNSGLTDDLTLMLAQLGGAQT